MGNEKVELNKEEDKEREKDSYINAAYLFIAVRLARETLSPIGSSISLKIISLIIFLMLLPLSCMK